MESFEIFAKILRTDKDFVKIAADELTIVSGHDNVLHRLTEINQQMIANRLERMKLMSGSHADTIFRALSKEIQVHDRKLWETFHRPVCDNDTGCSTLLGFAREISNVGKGFFLKEAKAREMLEKEPPKHILSFFKKDSVAELLKEKDLFEVFSALRFIEDKKWLNTVFFRQLDLVTPDDFEEREIKLHVLSGEWLTAAESFLKKKYHNVSHLKELGIIFVIPLAIDTPGETMRLFSLLLHYLHEVSFYSKLLRKYAAGDKDQFAARLISALRGDVLEKRFAEEDRGKKWMIVQQYLAKDDVNDWRLFEPHVNPEAIHWSKAENDIVRFGQRFPHIGLDFWTDLDFIGNYYQDASGVDVLVSFNLIDTVMSLVQEKEMIKYLYHHEEALWNKIFSEYIGQEKMEQLIIDNFQQGYIDITTI